MSENEQKDAKRFGLTPAEYTDLKAMLRYGMTIVVTVAITFVIVAWLAKIIGY
jgi:hypothetical protein